MRPVVSDVVAFAAELVAWATSDVGKMALIYTAAGVMLLAYLFFGG